MVSLRIKRISLGLNDEKMILVIELISFGEKETIFKLSFLLIGMNI